MSKTKKISVTSLKREDSKKYTKKVVRVGNYDVTIDEKLRPTTIQKLIADLIDMQDYFESNEIQIDIGTYTLVKILEYFTDITVPTDFDKQIQLMNLLIDLEYLKPILNAFDQDELNKIQDLMKKYAGNLQLLMSELTKELGEDEAEVEVVESKDSEK